MGPEKTSWTTEVPKTIILNYSREKKQNVKRGKNKRKKKKKGGRGQFEDPRGIWVVEHVAHHWEIKKKKLRAWKAFVRHAKNLGFILLGTGSR